MNDKSFTFSADLKVYPTKGNLVYEYNPFRNYRLEEDTVYYDDRLWSYKKFCEEFDNTGIYSKDHVKDIIDGTVATKLDKTKTAPVIYQKGLLVDFETNELHFSLENPVNITPQWSYDNSVNLIINDGKNPPRLINSRFSPTERNLYLICDRKGNNDSNIYDQGALFDIDTSLYRKTTTIPKLNFLGVAYGGNLGIGNYHFYFRYLDEDGNESDFFAESGLVSIFIGSTPDSVHTGFRSENSHKLVKFYLTNTDPGYYKLRVYYTVDTADLSLNATTIARMIEHDYIINESYNTPITITGFEKTTDVPLEAINPTYQIYGSVETLESCLNRLFLANVDRPEIPYNDLSDLALRFFPVLITENYASGVETDYQGSASNNYYDPTFIYNKVGYWDDEIYRFGIVFILADNTLTPVFNVRGVKDLKVDHWDPSKVAESIYVEGDDKKGRVYLTYDDETFLIDSGDTLENAKGVISIPSLTLNTIIGINFEVSDEVLAYLSKLQIKGYFFVRLKRIPTTLCQAYTIGIDSMSHTPVLPVTNILSYYNNAGTTSDNAFITESFLSLRNYLSSDDDYKDNKNKKTKELNHEFSEHLIGLKTADIKGYGAICPDYDVNSPFFNTLFTGSLFAIKPRTNTRVLKQASEERHFVLDDTEWGDAQNYTTAKIIGVEDNTKLVAINSKMFSARAGEAEEAFRYEYAARENKTSEAVNLLRGSYGPYLGISGYETAGSLIDIKIPDFKLSNMQDYFKIRYNDKQSYYAISDRIDINNLNDWITSVKTVTNDYNKKITIYKLSKDLYRGDCYICQFTHRLNRNFQDPSAPTNSIIVDNKCWHDNYEVSDGVVKKDNFDKINLGDVNAVGLGMWVTITIRSRYNLNIRSLDESQVDEKALTGHSRGFFPYYPITVNGSYKVPEALCYNQGFEKSLSYRYNYEVPDVPWIKNEFSNRIAYSNIHVTDAFRNGFRVFEGTHYRDYPKTYGSITKIVEWAGDLICIFEHGIGRITINERALAGQGNGGPVYINTHNVLPEIPQMIDCTFGSLWRESIVVTLVGIYGVDTVAKKIWRVYGNKIELLSDFKVLEFLNLNISLGERELTPIIGIRNVKSHYNEFKREIMFTFYDNLHGFEEKVWNLCYSEMMSTFTTFYSWVPSYSENIYNQFFTFDRNTSKWIAKLGISNHNNDFSDGITLDNNIFDKLEGDFSATLYLDNRTTSGENITYELERDNYGYYKYFTINNKDNSLRCSEEDYDKLLKICNENDMPVCLLNIKAVLTIDDSSNATVSEAYSGSLIDAGYYESVVAIIPSEKLDSLTTAFWKHGLAGIIDIADKIKPTNWYGKQHPFEFEIVVNANPDCHKIFDNLLIIGNHAAPESFHYEIVGDCYDFAKDKENMYIRQEATKELYLFNGSDVVFNDDYKLLEDTPREIGNVISNYYDKSTIFPLYYYRLDKINDIEDYYHLHGEKDSYSNSDLNFSALAGAEIVRYENLKEYRIWNHCKAVDIHDFENGGRMRGNMQYKEDKWDILINPVNFVLKNEPKSDWDNIYKSDDSSEKKMVPAEYNLFKPIEPSNKGTMYEVTLPSDWERNIVAWKDSEVRKGEIKLKDKFIKIRVRYSGEDLAVIYALTTLYSISYA